MYGHCSIHWFHYLIRACSRLSRTLERLAHGVSLLVLALQTVVLISIDLLCALIDNGLVQCSAAAHGELVPTLCQYHGFIVRVLG